MVSIRILWSSKIGYCEGQSHEQTEYAEKTPFPRITSARETKGLIEELGKEE